MHVVCVLCCCVVSFVCALRVVVRGCSGLSCVCIVSVGVCVCMRRMYAQLRCQVCVSVCVRFVIFVVLRCSCFLFACLLRAVVFGSCAFRVCCVVLAFALRVALRCCMYCLYVYLRCQVCVFANV